MDLGLGFNRALRILKLDGSAVEESARDPGMTTVVFVMILLAALGSAIGLLIQTGEVVGAVFGIIGGLIGGIIGLLIATLLTWIVAMIFGGKADFMELWRPYGLVSIVGVITGILAAVPAVGQILNIVIFLYLLVVSVVIIKHVYDFSIGKAVGVVVVELAIILVIAIVLAMLFGAAMFASIGALPIQ
ncbi:YIP1 family protein [Candidatus Woesearchaeota archaeon]|nr:YIP1 family protein [Candidatus Woesearchaeota archaeon]